MALLRLPDVLRTELAEFLWAHELVHFQDLCRNLQETKWTIKHLSIDERAHEYNEYTYVTEYIDPQVLAFDAFFDKYAPQAQRITAVARRDGKSMLFCRSSGLAMQFKHTVQGVRRLDVFLPPLHGSGGAMWSYWLDWSERIPHRFARLQRLSVSFEDPATCPERKSEWTLDRVEPKDGCLAIDVRGVSSDIKFIDCSARRWEDRNLPRSHGLCTFLLQLPIDRCTALLVDKPLSHHELLAIRAFPKLDTLVIENSAKGVPDSQHYDPSIMKLSSKAVSFSMWPYPSTLVIDEQKMPITPTDVSTFLSSNLETLHVDAPVDHDPDSLSADLGLFTREKFLAYVWRTCPHLQRVSGSWFVAFGGHAELPTLRPKNV